MKRSLSILSSLLLLNGCAVGPDFTRPEAPNVSSYVKNNNPQTISSNQQDEYGATQQLKDLPVKSDWWTQFGNQKLNQLVDTALKNNPNVGALQQTLEGAMNTALAQERSLTLPAINANLSETKQRFNPATFGQPSPPSIFSLTNASIGVSYSLDLFGGIRRQIEATYAQAEAQKYTYEAARITLAANVVTTAIRRAAVKKQIELTESIIEKQQEIYQTTLQRYQIGALSQMDTANAKEQLALIKSTLPSLRNQYVALENQLAVYLGQLPAQHELSDLNLNEIKLPQELPLSVPSELVHQRPDILTSEALLHAATAQVGVAISGEYPNITINASYGALAANPNSIFSRNSAIWSLSSVLVQPFFRGGALEAQTDAAKALLKSAALQYQQTVLNAFQNVSDTITSLQTDGQYLDQYHEAYEAASSQSQLTQTQYETGSSSHLQLLTARLHQQQTEINLIQARASRLNDTAALFLALGGGWNNLSSHTSK